ncbi:MAG: helix-turn-helix transcriptional regulator [Tannerella sp.]|jgi:DNA-binding CsgD family transcriptional regulator|nr:helix-turn-helix transcriptional regulator [Tannerella sp.]
MILSKREEQVLTLCAVGLSAKEIADKKNISPETVRKTISNIKLKIGLQKATELVAFYYCRLMKMDFMEFREQVLSVILLFLISIMEISCNQTDNFTRRTRTMYRTEVRAKKRFYKHQI